MVNRYQVTISNSDKDKIPSLCLEPLEKAKKGEVVQDLAARSGNWKFYDENFRFLRQAQPASFPWGLIHWELWMRAQHSFRKPTFPISQGHSKPHNKSTPKGYCFKFHKGVDCDPGCAFKHLCYKREGPPCSH